MVGGWLEDVFGCWLVGWLVEVLDCKGEILTDLLTYGTVRGRT